MWRTASSKPDPSETPDSRLARVRSAVSVRFAVSPHRSPVRTPFDIWLLSVFLCALFATLPSSLEDSYGTDCGFKGASVELVLALSDTAQSPRDPKFIASADPASLVAGPQARPAQILAPLVSISPIPTPPIRAPPQVA